MFAAIVVILLDVCANQHLLVIVYRLENNFDSAAYKFESAIADADDFVDSVVVIEMNVVHIVDFPIHHYYGDVHANLHHFH